jgi:hypothetical protein
MWLVHMFLNWGDVWLVMGWISGVQFPTWAAIFLFATTFRPVVVPSSILINGYFI